MKQVTRSGIFKYVFLLFFAIAINAIVLAQGDTTVTATTKTTTSETTQATESSDWYKEPWIWVVGGAVLILIIVALTRGNKGDNTGRTDKVTVTKTTSSESN